jgi:hypothetical protein
MNYEQIFIGGATAAMCAAGLFSEGWLLEHTRKGQRLVNWFGDGRAQWVLRCLLAVGIGFGLALATGLVNPIHW